MEAFYKQDQHLIDYVPCKEIVIVWDDWNTEVEEDTQEQWKESYGIGQRL